MTYRVNFDGSFTSALDPQIGSVLTSALTGNGTTPSTITTPQLNPTDVASQILAGSSSSQDVMNALDALASRVSPAFADSVATQIQSNPSMSGTWGEIANNSPAATAPSGGSSIVDKILQGSSFLNAGSVADTALGNPMGDGQVSQTTASAQGISGDVANTPLWKWTLADVKGAMLGLVLGLVGLVIILFTLYSIFARSNMGATIRKSVSSTAAVAA